METLSFFSYFVHYLKNHQIEGTVHYDKSSHEQYASIGKDQNGYPHIFLSKSKSIGNIDVFVLEYYDPITQSTIEKQKFYANHLISFLGIIYSTEPNGYILMRKVRDKTVRYQSFVNDIFGEFMRMTHMPISPKNTLYPFLHKQNLQWSVYLKNKGVEEEFTRFSLLKESIQGILTEPGTEIYSFKLINYDHVAQKIMFKMNNTQYHISWKPGDVHTYELRISGRPDYLPVIFSDPNANMLELVSEVELLNRLQRLFE